MPTSDPQPPASDVARARVYDRPGALAIAWRPVSLILVAVLALVVGSLVYYKYVS